MRATLDRRSRLTGYCEEVWTNWLSPLYETPQHARLSPVEEVTEFYGSDSVRRIELAFRTGRPVSEVFNVAMADGRIATIRSIWKPMREGGKVTGLDGRADMLFATPTPVLDMRLGYQKALDALVAGLAGVPSERVALAIARARACRVTP